MTQNRVIRISIFALSAMISSNGYSAEVECNPASVSMDRPQIEMSSINDCGAGVSEAKPQAAINEYAACVKKKKAVVDSMQPKGSDDAEKEAEKVLLDGASADLQRLISCVAGLKSNPAAVQATAQVEQLNHDQAVAKQAVEDSKPAKPAQHEKPKEKPKTKTEVRQDMKEARTNFDKKVADVRAELPEPPLHKQIDSVTKRGENATKDGSVSASEGAKIASLMKTAGNLMKEQKDKPTAARRKEIEDLLNQARAILPPLTAEQKLHGLEKRNDQALADGHISKDQHDKIKGDLEKSHDALVKAHKEVAALKPDPISSADLNLALTGISSKIPSAPREDQLKGLLGRIQSADSNEKISDAEAKILKDKVQTAQDQLAKMKQSGKDDAAILKQIDATMNEIRSELPKRSVAAQIDTIENRVDAAVKSGKLSSREGVAMKNQLENLDNRHEVSIDDHAAAVKKVDQAAIDNIIAQANNAAPKPSRQERIDELQKRISDAGLDTKATAALNTLISQAEKDLQQVQSGGVKQPALLAEIDQSIAQVSSALPALSQTEKIENALSEIDVAVKNHTMTDAKASQLRDKLKKAQADIVKENAELTDGDIK